jgi:hypothetical protein
VPLTLGLRKRICAIRGPDHSGRRTPAAMRRKRMM